HLAGSPPPHGRAGADVPVAEHVEPQVHHSPPSPVRKPTASMASSRPVYATPSCVQNSERSSASRSVTAPPRRVVSSENRLSATSLPTNSPDRRSCTWPPARTFSPSGFVRLSAPTLRRRSFQCR